MQTMPARIFFVLVILALICPSVLPAAPEQRVALVIGNAPAVQLQYDDLGVDLAPHTKVGVARLTLN